jgi:uncharacterized protein (DUF488 family)
MLKIINDLSVLGLPTYLKELRKSLLSSIREKQQRSQDGLVVGVSADAPLCSWDAKSTA